MVVVSLLSHKHKNKQEIFSIKEKNKQAKECGFGGLRRLTGRKEKALTSAWSSEGIYNKGGI